MKYGPMSHNPSHDEFLRLCAVATAGQLTSEEQKRLQDHLRLCPSCTAAMREYEEIAAKTIPTMASQFISGAQGVEDSGWSEDQAEAALLARIARGKNSPGSTVHQAHRDAIRSNSQSCRRFEDSEMIWRHVWLQYAAAVLLVISLGILAYRARINPVREISSSGTQPASSHLAEGTTPLIDGTERRQAEEAISRKDETIVNLRGEQARQSAELARLKDIESKLKTELSRYSERSSWTVEKRSNLERELETAQANVSRLEQELDSVKNEAAKAFVSTKDLAAQVAALSAQLHVRDDTIVQQQELLAHDRDIRELMGARDLYIAEVYDVADSGATKKPYGRVFYTKGKSLVFYAYDLDKQKTLKNASIFQGWGRRGPDSKHAFNLGVFYEDNSENKRWVLRCDDPKTLAQIDAVFVTVEPNGGSQAPSARRLLFASLKIEPNHP